MISTIAFRKEFIILSGACSPAPSADGRGDRPAVMVGLGANPFLFNVDPSRRTIVEDG